MDLHVQFETSRLLVRPFDAGDFEDYYGYILDPELQHMLGLNGITSRESAYETFSWLMCNRTFLALERKDTGNVIGHICLHPAYSAIADDPEFNGKKGYSLSFAVSSEERRKGYMEEALRGLVDCLFSRFETDFIDCEYPDFNSASGALQEKLGFRFRAQESLEGINLIVNVLEK